MQDFCQNEWLRMKSGEFIYILPGVQHQLEITEGRPCSVLNLEFALTSEETAVEAEILLEKIRDFQKCFQMPQGYIAANDGRNLGYAIKDYCLIFRRARIRWMIRSSFLDFCSVERW